MKSMNDALFIIRMDSLGARKSAFEGGARDIQSEVVALTVAFGDIFFLSL